MHTTLSTETRRRLALGLLIAPAHRNRRRRHWRHRHTIAGYQFEALSLAAAIVILTGLLLAARI